MHIKFRLGIGSVVRQHSKPIRNLHVLAKTAFPFPSSIQALIPEQKPYVPNQKVKLTTEPVSIISERAIVVGLISIETYKFKKRMTHRRKRKVV